MREENEYLLGTHDDELSRLGFQHQVWMRQGTFFDNFLPHLVQTGYLSGDEHRAFDAVRAARAADPAAFLTTPPMVEVVGAKR